MSEQDRNTQKFFNSLLAGQFTDISPEDCGEFKEYARIAQQRFEDDPENIGQVIERILSSNPRLYQVVCGDPESERAFNSFSFSELLRLPDKAFIVDDIVGEGDIAMIYGAPGSGKSFVVIDLAVSAALGRPWIGEHNIPRSLKVAYCTGEGKAGIKSRLLAAVNGRVLLHEDMAKLNESLAIFFNVPQLFGKDELHSIEAFITEWEMSHSHKLDLLIIDTLHNASLGADENSAQEMGVVIEATKRISNALSCSVILVHHTNKAGAYRGSSALHGAMDLMIEVNHNNELGAITCFKSKDAEPFKPQNFKIKGEHLSKSAYVQWVEWSPKEDTARDKVLGLLRQQEGVSFSIKQICDETGLKPQTATQAAAKLADENLVLRQYKHPERAPSNHNPMLYWISTKPEQVETEQG